MQEFPSSEAAVSVLLGEAYEGIDFTTFEERLNAALESDRTLDQAAARPQSNNKEVCLETAVSEKTSVNMLVEFSVEASGNLSGLPEMIKPETPNFEARMQYIQLVAALEKCAPYRINGAGTLFQLEVSDTGTLSLAASLPEMDGARMTVKAENVSMIPVGSSETEKQMNLKRQSVRDIQARLFVIGYDPNGIDGVIGRGTRSAIQLWQTSVGAPANGFLNTTQLELLKDQSQVSLTQWLRVQKNAKLYNPPRRATTQTRSNRLRNGWFRDRNGKYCRKTKIGLIYCTPRRPSDA